MRPGPVSRREPPVKVHLGVLKTRRDDDLGEIIALPAEALFDHGVCRKLTRIGLPDQFIECGATATLQRRYGIDTQSLIAAGSAAPEGPQ